jgi:hypothetical protein
MLNSFCIDHSVTYYLGLQLSVMSPVECWNLSKVSANITVGILFFTFPETLILTAATFTVVPLINRNANVIFRLPLVTEWLDLVFGEIRSKKVTAVFNNINYKFDKTSLITPKVIEGTDMYMDLRKSRALIYLNIIYKCSLTTSVGQYTNAVRVNIHKH